MKILRFILGVLVLFAFALVPHALAVHTKQPGRSSQQNAKPIKRKSVETKSVETKNLLSPPEAEIIAEINLARTSPTQYLHYLEDFRRSYNGKELRFSDGQTLITNEGVAALDEAISFVRSVKPLAPLEVSKGLVLAAKDHLNDLVKTGKSGHRGSDGSSVEDRMNRYGTWSDSVGEDIVYHSRTARENVISLIIDDGVANRGHRKNIFKPTFGVVGIALDPAMKTGTLCIITFAGGFKEKTSTEVIPAVPTATKY